MSVEDLPGDPEAIVEAPDGGTAILFVPVPEARSGKNRGHLDLQPCGERTRDQEVDRAVALDATLFADHRARKGYGFAVLADPEGDEFCVERSAAEVAANPRRPG